MLDLFSHLCRLFVIFNSPLYGKVSLYFLGLLLDWKAKKHPAWNTFQQSASSFHEEFGETSLGTLTQSLAGGSTMSDLKTVRRRYLLLPVMKQNYETAKMTHGLDEDDKFEFVKLGSHEFKSVEVFLRSFVQRNVKGNYLSYSGDPAKWLHAGAAAKSFVKETKVMLFLSAEKSSWDAALIWINKFNVEVTKRFWVQPILEEVKSRQILDPTVAPVSVDVLDLDEGEIPQAAPDDTEDDFFNDEGTFFVSLSL